MLLKTLGPHLGLWMCIFVLSKDLSIVFSNEGLVLSSQLLAAVISDYVLREQQGFQKW